MEINNFLFTQTIKQKLAKESEELSRKYDIASKQDYLPKEDILNTKKVENEIGINSIGSTLSDDALEKIYKDVIKTSSSNEIKLSTTYKDFSPEEISRIKTVIYNIHNPDSPIPDEPNIPQEEKKSFISEFSDTETLFEYLNKLNPEITKETGITRAQLTALTQNDNWEDSHYDFFGSLNRIFNQLDKNSDSVLTFEEIKAFIGEELGEDFINYKNKINAYTEQIQSYYESLDNQEKLEFAIEKTREYLEASGLTNQLEALERLLDIQDMYNEIHKGNISIADLNENNDSDYKTLGSYMYYQYPNGSYIISTDKDFYDEENGENVDLGITLDISLLEGEWYELVNTLVHELTHAAGALYYPCNETPSVYINKSLEDLLKAGAIDETDKQWYEDNSQSMNIEDQKWKDFFKKLAGLWGEYFAYQADADYNDSIGADVYYTGTPSTTAVDGKDEKQTIEDHIEASYDGEPVPDYKWWSYG